MKWLFLTFIVSLAFLNAEAQKTTLSQPPKNDTFIEDKTIVDPSFPGGKKAFGKFLAKNLKWPDQIDGQGRVIVSFVVEKDGHLTNIKIAKKSLPEFDAEALRVVRKSPKWIPATKNGIPIKSVKSIPINFTIGEKFNEETYYYRAFISICNCCKCPANLYFRR